MTALKTGARVVAYEYGMLKEGLRWRASLRTSASTSSQTTENAAIEVTLKHARNLLSFFSTGGWSDDVKMCDYLVHPPRIALPYLRKNRKRLNRKLAHPTYSRSRLSSEWNSRAIEAEIDDAIRGFLERLACDEPRLRRLFEIHGL